MGLFDKLKAALGGNENASREDSMSERAAELKRKMDEARRRAEEDLSRSQEMYGSDDDVEVEEDDELVENRAKPIFVVRLKRFEAPLTEESVEEYEDEFAKYGTGCVLLRDKEEKPVSASCLFGDTTEELMKQALEDWEETEPIVDYMTDFKVYNGSIDDDTVKKICYYIVNGFGEQAFDVEYDFPIDDDSLIRVIRESSEGTTVKDYVIYPEWSSLEDDRDGWVSRMITEHGIEL